MRRLAIAFALIIGLGFLVATAQAQESTKTPTPAATPEQLLPVVGPCNPTDGCPSGPPPTPEPLGPDNCPWDPVRDSHLYNMFCGTGGFSYTTDCMGLHFLGSARTGMPLTLFLIGAFLGILLVRPFRPLLRKEKPPPWQCGACGRWRTDSEIMVGPKRDGEHILYCKDDPDCVAIAMESGGAH